MKNFPFIHLVVAIVCVGITYHSKRLGSFWANLEFELKKGEFFSAINIKYFFGVEQSEDDGELLIKVLEEIRHFYKDES